MARPAKTNTTVNGHDYYRIRKTIDGVRKNFYGTSKTDAEKKYRDYLEQASRDALTKASERDTATFGARAEDYIENTLKVSQKYAKGTVTAYVSKYNTYVKGTWLDEHKVFDLTPAIIQKFYNELDISKHGIKELNKFMYGLCKWMQLNGYSGDWLSAVEIPKKEDTTRHDEIIIWEDEELTKIFHAFDSMGAPHRQDFLVHVLLYSGARISEALALKYTDIRNGSINIDRQYYLGELKEPKWGSKRQVPMHRDLVSRFQTHREWHLAEQAQNGYTTDFIFTTSTGQLYHQSSVRKALRRFYDANGIPYKHIHAYRATFCTQLCRCGVPLEVASKLMGHKSMEVTAQHYALVRQESMQDAIDKLSFDF